MFRTKGVNEKLIVGIYAVALCAAVWFVDREYVIGFNLKSIVMCTYKVLLCALIMSTNVDINVGISPCNWVLH